MLCMILDNDIGEKCKVPNITIVVKENEIKVKESQGEIICIHI